jgi:hypothetical protein
MDKREAQVYLDLSECLDHRVTRETPVHPGKMDFLEEMDNLDHRVYLVPREMGRKEILDLKEIPDHKVPREIQDLLENEGILQNVQL